MIRTSLRQADGFTIVELAIVVGIMAILAAIAIPTFAGQMDHAHDVAAQSLATHAMNIERSYQLDNGQFTASRRDLLAYEPGIVWNQRKNPPGTVRIRMRSRFAADEVCVYAQSKSGDWFAIYENATSATLYGRPDRLRNCSPKVARNWSPDGW